MNEGLFEKYKKVLHKKQLEKDEVIKIIKETTGILLKDNELELHNKLISFKISSVKRNSIFKKNIQQKFLKKGYSIKM